MPVALGNRLVFPWPRRVIRPDSASKPTTTGMMRSRWPRDARPVRGSASYPARGRPPLRHLLPGHRSDRPRHPETRTSQRTADLGEPSPCPRRIGGLERHLPGPPAGSLSPRQSHRYDTGQPERNEYLLRHRIRAFRSDHGGDDNDTRQHSQPIYSRPRRHHTGLSPFGAAKADGYCYPADSTLSRSSVTDSART
jgi:hypothetical protein